MNDLGKKVAYYRKLKGFSIKNLADNICDESTIYRLENGKQLPRVEILIEICMKLELPFNALFPFNEEVENLKKLCREFSYSGDYLSLELTLEKCEEVLLKLKAPYRKHEFHKFIDWHKAIMIHKKDGKHKVAISILGNLVTQKSCSSELDINIMNSTGLIYQSLKDYDAAFTIFNNIYPKVSQLKIIEDSTLIPRVGYNYASSLYHLQDYIGALEVANRLLFYLETNYLTYLLGEIYYIIGVLENKLGYIKDAEAAFKQSIMVFSLIKSESQKAQAEKAIKELYT